MPVNRSTFTMVGPGLEKKRILWVGVAWLHVHCIFSGNNQGCWTARYIAGGLVVFDKHVL